MRDQHNDPLNDALAREIEQALAVEPSPEFEARVRQRVAQESPLAEVPFGWWRRAVGPALWPAAFAIAAGAVVIVSVLWPGREPRDQPSRDQQAAQIDSPVQRSVPTPPVADGRSASHAVVPPVAAADTRRAPAADARRTRVADTRRARTDVTVEPSIQVVETRRSPRDPFGDVQVSVGEVMAVRQVAALLSPEDLLKPPPPSTAPEAINELEIAPITVAPIQLRPLEGVAE